MASASTGLGAPGAPAPVASTAASAQAAASQAAAAAAAAAAPNSADVTVLRGGPQDSGPSQSSSRPGTVPKMRESKNTEVPALPVDQLIFHTSDLAVKPLVGNRCCLAASCSALLPPVLPCCLLFCLSARRRLGPRLGPRLGRSHLCTCCKERSHCRNCSPTLGPRLGRSHLCTCFLKHGAVTRCSGPCCCKRAFALQDMFTCEASVHTVDALDHPGDWSVAKE